MARKLLEYHDRPFTIEQSLHLRKMHHKFQEVRMEFLKQQAKEHAELMKILAKI